MTEDKVALAVKNLSATTPAGELDPISFNLHAGEIGFVSHPTDFSVLLRAVTANAKINSGSVHFPSLGITLDSTAAHQSKDWLRNIGFVFRDCGLMANLTLLENINLPLSYHQHLYCSEDRLRPAEQTLQELNIDERFWTYRPSEVPSYIVKRALFARAFALNPKVLLIDEPTALLRPEDLHEIIQILAVKRFEKMAILLGSDDLRVGLAVADWFWCKEKGIVTRKQFPMVAGDVFAVHWLEQAKLLIRGEVA